MKQFIIIALVAVLGLILLISGYLMLQGYLSRSDSPPGLSDGRLTPCGEKPNAVCSETGTDTAHFVEPVGLCLLSMSSVVADVESLGGKVIHVETGYLAAEFSSSVFGFVDDLELRKDSVAGVIHIRSASRVGYSDMGVNRKRAEQLRALLEGQQ
ncbi:DUF1499 domain-containing protein [Amphritea japonica]|uniref:DUF1499 domain-containing protein n=1 Tax=Amphritea japonica ATCC BAA-1530 TaxID=1278309 RepID=A0A7R6PBW4_9GAMM|nr:DUF1499 domain-containing protein [Amphritea japonica]BBB26181.1 conserved hypothetical protein [Amphritea japonica ATCC BAA-1530]